MGVLAGFGDHGFIATQEIDIVTLKEVRPKEEPEQRSPGQGGSEKALDRAIAATLARPAGNTQHGDSSVHHQQGVRDTAELASRRHRDLGVEAEQEWYNSNHGFCSSSVVCLVAPTVLQKPFSFHFIFGEGIEIIDGFISALLKTCSNRDIPDELDRVHGAGNMHLHAH